MVEDSPTQVKTKEPNKILVEGESMEEYKAMETKAPENLRTEPDIWKLYTDEASNKHGSGAGLILIDPDGAEYSYALRLNFANSNNDAEYEALLAGLRIATKKMKISHIPREENRKADALSKLAAVQCEGLTKGVLIEELNEHGFGIPATIITDNGTQLINDPFKSWAEGLGIKLVSTSIYHPQANGAVERANRSIIQGIKTRLHLEGGAWVEELS
ncbi:reverse transcriptase domain-containing protein [Tanacetum coccineum]